MSEKGKKDDQVNVENDDKDIDTSQDKSKNEKDKKDKKEKKGREKRNKKDKKEKNGRKKFIIIPATIALLSVGVMAGVIAFNPLDLREKYLRSTIDRIPFISEIVPPAEIDGEAETKTETKTEAPPSASVVELQNKIDELNAELEQVQGDYNTLSEENEINLQEIARLQEIENQQIQFKDDKAEFDKMIAENNPSAFAKFYESIAPENAEVLYKEAVVAVENSKELRKYISDIDAMDDSSAAKALEELIPSDMSLVVSIMRNLNNEKSGSILSAMSAQNAASLIKAMSPS